MVEKVTLISCLELKICSKGREMRGYIPFLDIFFNVFTTEILLCELKAVPPAEQLAEEAPLKRPGL